MRKLNRYQKEELRQYVEANFNDIGFFHKAEDLPYPIYMRLMDLGEFETISAAIESYIQELLEKETEKRLKNV